MFLRVILTTLILFSTLLSVEYPKTFSQLATPLYSSLEPLEKYSDIKSLNVALSRFKQSCNVAMKNGFRADESVQKRDIQEYLVELRALQKEYDYLAHLINNSIEKSIKEDDYELFFKLINLELEGVLKNSSLKLKQWHFMMKILMIIRAPT